MPEELPAHVIDFLRDYVTSFEALEAILVLRVAPHPWSASEMGERIRVPTERAADALEWLHKSKLLELVPADEPERRYRLAPETPEGARAVDDLVRAFEEQRATVLRVMNAQAVERVRTSAFRAFSHAFLIKKRDDDA
jgi:hypothetical protein